MDKIERIHYKKTNREIENFEIVDLQLFFSTRPKRLLEKDYRLDFWAVIYIIEGHGMHYIDFRPYQYEPNSVLFIRKNQVQHFEINTDVRGYIIHINEPMMVMLNYFNTDFIWEVVDSSYGSPVVNLPSDKGNITRVLIDMIYNEYVKFNDKGSDNFIKSLFESFILSIEKELGTQKNITNSADYTIFKEFRALVEENYKERKPLGFYAKSLGVSKKTINLATRNMVDMSAKEFINERLYLEIKRYLSQGELMIYEIAEMLGFDEPANMTKFFKRFENNSPKDFRAACLK